MKDKPTFIFLKILIVIFVIFFSVYGYGDVISSHDYLKVSSTLTAERLKEKPIAIIRPWFPRDLKKDLATISESQEEEKIVDEAVSKILKNAGYKIISSSEVEEKIRKAWTEREGIGREVNMLTVLPDMLIEHLRTPSEWSLAESDRKAPREDIMTVGRYLEVNYIMRVLIKHAKRLPNTKKEFALITFQLCDTKTGFVVFNVTGKATRSINEEGNLIEEACKAGLSKLPGFTK